MNKQFQLVQESLISDKKELDNIKKSLKKIVSSAIKDMRETIDYAQGRIIDSNDEIEAIKKDFNISDSQKKKEIQREIDYQKEYSDSISYMYATIEILSQKINNIDNLLIVSFFAKDYDNYSIYNRRDKSSYKKNIFYKVADWYIRKRINENTIKEKAKKEIINILTKFVIYHQKYHNRISKDNISQLKLILKEI